MIHEAIVSFNAGELSPLMDARSNVEKYAAGCRRLENFIIHTHGPIFRRPGLEYLGEADDSEVKSRLFEFVFSTTTTFVIEMALGAFRFWSNGVLVPVSPVVGHPYAEDEFFQVQVKQINDVVYFAHPSHAPRKLSRVSDTNWTFAELNYSYPPLLDENIEKESIGTPTVTEELDVATEEWHEFTVAAGDYNVLFTLDPTEIAAGTKVHRFQRWTGSTWVTVKSTSWTTTLPTTFGPYTFAASTICRQTYTGAVHDDSNFTQKVEIKLDGAGTLQDALDLCVTQPASLASAVVPAGEWTAVVTCGASIPTGHKLYLQKKTGSTWANLKDFTKQLQPSETITYYGAKLLVATEMRFKWYKPSDLPDSRAMAGGTAVLNSIVYAASTQITITPSTTTGTGTLTASAALFNEDMVGGYFQIVHRRTLSSTELVGEADASWADLDSDPIRVVGKWDFFTYGTWKGTILLERQMTDGNYEVLRSWTSNDDRNVVASGEQEKDANMRIRALSGISGATAVTPALPRFVLESADSRSYGIVKITGYTSTTVVAMQVIRGLGATTATPYWTEGAWSDHQGFPSALSLHQGRLWFGGTKRRPQGLWASVSGDFENFRRSSNDDGSIAILLASETANPIRWLASAPGSLLVGTGGEEWAITGTDDAGIITPVSAKAERQSGYSSNTVPARLAQDVTLFVQRDGRRLRQLLYSDTQQSYSASDLTVLASHITDGGIVQIAFQQAPTPIVWAITGEGKLIGMTFEREQNVFGWHEHNTDGEFESVAVIPGTPSDEVWVTVKRTINGEIKRYVERFSVRGDSTSWDQPLIYSDSAIVVTNDPASATVTGLDHLEGCEVQVLTDGAVHAVRTVNGGSISLEYVASEVIVGLAFESFLQPTKREISLNDGTAQGRRFKLNGATLRVNNSLGGEISSNPDDEDVRWERVIDRVVADPLDARPPLFTGDKKVIGESGCEDAINIAIRQTEPLPLNVVALIIRYDVYGI